MMMTDDYLLVLTAVIKLIDARYVCSDSVTTSTNNSIN